MSTITGDPEFEAWWKRYWGALGDYHEVVRKELALAAWKEAMRVSKLSPPPGWTDPAPKDTMTAHDRRIEDTLATLRAERDQYRNALGDLLTAIENWKKMSPLYGAGGSGHGGVATQTQQA